jgi:hypothetical protein
MNCMVLNINACEFIPESVKRDEEWYNEKVREFEVMNKYIFDDDEYMLNRDRRRMRERLRERRWYIYMLRSDGIRVSRREYEMSESKLR